jgi:hypothetical protein
LKLTIQEYLGVPSDWKVKENIRHEIVLMPNARDIKTAKCREPTGCALHNAACRTFDIPNCAIGGRWAYIPQRDAKGKPYIARVQATVATRRAIKAFDETGEMPEAGFRFIPIAPCQTARAKNRYNAVYQAKDKDPDAAPRSWNRRVTRAMPYLAAA